jgi:hypothetical protein
MWSNSVTPSSAATHRPDNVFGRLGVSNGVSNGLNGIARDGGIGEQPITAKSPDPWVLRRIGTHQTHPDQRAHYPSSSGRNPNIGRADVGRPDSLAAPLN